jgi:membrane protein required for colicin V production
MMTEFDVLVIIVVLLSSMIGFLRGIIREIFSILGWIGAAILTFFLFPYVADKMDGLFKSILVVNIASIFVVFMMVLMVLSVFNAMLLDNLREIRAGSVDRSLGLLFGLVRGVFIVSVFHFLILALHNKDTAPKWLEDGETYGITQPGGEKMYAWAKDYVAHLQGEDRDLGDMYEDATEPLREKREVKKIKLPERKIRLPERIPGADEE